MRRRAWRRGWIGLLAVLALCACGALRAPTPQRVLRVGMILGSGGLGDRSFNDSAYEGLVEAQRRYGIRFEVLTHSSQAEDIERLRLLVRHGSALVIGVGYENAPTIERLAAEFPDQPFAVVDAVAAGANVASIVYREQEGDFLMGVLAAMLTQTKRVGFIGGADVPPVRRIEAGFRQGVAYQDAQVEVLADLAGTFSDPALGKALALAQYAAGADVIYNAAGRTGLGIIEAAQETGHLTLGTSGDQRYLAPGHVVGNRPKRVDRAVLVLVEECVAGRFTPGTRSWGLAEGGLALGPFDERIVTREMLARLDALQRRIIAGEIVIALPE